MGRAWFWAPNGLYQPRSKAGGGANGRSGSRGPIQGKADLGGPRDEEPALFPPQAVFPLSSAVGGRLSQRRPFPGCWVPAHCPQAGTPAARTSGVWPQCPPCPPHAHRPGCAEGSPEGGLRGPCALSTGSLSDGDLDAGRHPPRPGPSAATRWLL